MVQGTEKKRTFALVITAEEYELLRSPGLVRAVAEARHRDPLEVAMDRRIPHARLVATQVKYLARAERKLPTYAAAQCILPPRAFEQASSEACAAHKCIGGDSVLDLTCGLGVDALFLSRRFRRVVTLERDPVLARIAAENFARLGAGNVEVVASPAEEYLAREGVRFDWVYADPDRRDGDGRKLVRLEDCSPDILALRPLINRVAPRLCLKNSPLFDVGEALRLFPSARVEAVSLEGECKEVLIYADGRGPLLTATALGTGSFSARPGEQPPRHPNTSTRRTTAGSSSPTPRCRRPAWCGFIWPAGPTCGAKTGTDSPRNGPKGCWAARWRSTRSGVTTRSRSSAAARDSAARCSSATSRLRPRS